MEKSATTLILTFVALMLCLTSRECHAWTFSVTPNRVINYESNSPTFHSNGSYFKLLYMDDKSVLIGARNNVYNLTITRLAENVKNRIEWPSSEAHKEMCMLKGKNVSDCQNYIRVYAHVSDEQIVLCGTNSFKPACRYYKVNPISGSDSAVHEKIKEFEGEAISPYSPNQNNTYIYTSDMNELYTATTAGFAGSQQLIYRQPLLNATSDTFTGIAPQTLRTDSRFDYVLNKASFVNAAEYNGYILFFFREQAIENQNCGGKSVYSRVARVCKNDKGGAHSFNDRFSSFIKTRLNCSMPGDYPFYFDEIQATSDVVDGIYGNDRDALVYTVMTTNDNAIDGSAICVYSMNSILAAFEGRFKGQRDMSSVWRSVDDSDVPTQRPGKCVDDSRTLPMSTVNFILKHPLMDGAINPIHESPLLVHTGSNYKFTTIAVDPQIETASGKIYDVVFVGTDNGQILKMINTGDAIDENRPIVVSEQQVLPLGTRIKEIKISQATQTLIVVSDEFVKTIPLHRCAELNQCSQCIGSRDPYCVWDNINRECIFYNKTVMNKNTQLYMESIDGKNDNVCGEQIVPSIIQQQQQNQKSMTMNNNINSNININSNAINNNNPQTHGTIMGKGQSPTDSENKEEEEIRKHKYHHIPVVQAPAHQGTEFYEPQIQTSSASIIVLFIIAALILGVIIGFAISKCANRQPRNAFPFGTTPDSHRNHLGWPVPTKQLLSLPTMNNGGKDINLLMNANATTINKDSKKDNLELEFSLGNKDRLNECKNSNESLDKETCKSAVISTTGGTLQKVKKTYI
ncbi:unnamed protein product [Chironomus riparius]|uniref:Sema domain-containing protein n=1 Tax=Chironomus riparius TaxID=315576 RepID=A0A9N9S0Q3_9DIPT|nr:unnamed protein product [Chironomus riparius]